jgi:1,4-dihydroxy-6-naphthoate synthase
LLLTVFFPHIKNKTEVFFSEIENHVISGKSDVGLLIHEGRFTYEKKNLYKLFDLGELWEKRMHTPLPLGCICALRNIDQPDRYAISNLIRQSIEYAFQYPAEGKLYVKEHAAEMAEDVIEKHIALYVNNFSVALGAEGRKAIEFILQKGYENGLLPVVTQPLFN